MRSTAFSRHIEELLARFLEKEAVTIKKAVPAHGGSINESFVLETTEGKFFLKRNDANLFPGMFEAESRGLNQLAITQTIKVPDPYFCGNFKGQGFLVMEYIQPGLQDEGFWEKFGLALAELHKKTAENYGYEENNYIGSLPQSNKQHRQWFEFFAEERLRPLVQKATEKNLLLRTEIEMFEKLYHKLDGFFPVELPALLHGDLWSGNFLCSVNGPPVIFDPAIYYGHREMDIAMSKLFGGFQQRFYSAYNEARPLEKGWEERAEVCNLYPLLVHLILFGSGYHKQIELTLRKFTA
ncbi:MAG: fructosamine kinase family protein [Bacteroidota bacterium]